MQEPPQNYQDRYTSNHQSPGHINPASTPNGNSYFSPPGYSQSQNYYPQPYYPQPAKENSFRIWIFLLMGGIALFLIAAVIGVAFIFGDVASKVTAGSPAQPAAAQSWKDFSSKEGRFKLVFPGTPTSQNQVVNLPNFTTTTLYMWSLDTSANNYMASYNDYSEAIVKAPTENLLNGARDGAIANTKGTFKSEKRISYGNFPGREITYTIDGNKTIVQRVYIANKRLYQIAVGFYTGKEVASDTTRFFNSFQITG